jgi:hypothetical protein
VRFFDDEVVEVHCHLTPGDGFLCQQAGQVVLNVAHERTPSISVALVKDERHRVAILGRQ